MWNFQPNFFVFSLFHVERITLEKVVLWIKSVNLALFLIKTAKNPTFYVDSQSRFFSFF